MDGASVTAFSRKRILQGNNVSPKANQTWFKCRYFSWHWIIRFSISWKLQHCFHWALWKVHLWKRDERKKTNGASFPVDLLSSFTKNNQRKPTHCGKKIIKQGKAVCPLELTKELLEEEVVCTTSLKHEEPNKWSWSEQEWNGDPPSRRPRSFFSWWRKQLFFDRWHVQS